VNAALYISAKAKFHREGFDVSLGPNEEIVVQKNGLTHIFESLSTAHAFLAGYQTHEIYRLQDASSRPVSTGVLRVEQ
jgi:hypothetical protein